MTKPVEIKSPADFQQLLSSHKVVVADFYADWCGPCKVVAPHYAQLAAQLSRPGKLAFSKINVDNNQQIAQAYSVTAMPTFIVFKNGAPSETIKGADPAKLNNVIKRLAADVEGDDGSAGAGGAGAGGSSGSWMGASLPRGYGDVTDSVDVRGLDLLNADSDFGDFRTLLNGSRPSSLAGKGKGKAEGGESKKDWVESDTDEQLMLFIPFNALLKIHTLHITSVPPPSGDDGTPMRPKTIHLYTNRAYNLGFDEAEGIPATQVVTLSEKDWDKETGTAKVELRFVKFQNVTSLVVFVVDGDGSGEKTRVDRLRIVGETGEKREMGKLEKVGHED